MPPLRFIEIRYEDLVQQPRAVTQSLGDFLKEQLTEDLVRLAWENSVLPFLEEHFFADPDQLKRFDLDRLRNAAPEPAANEAETLNSSDEA